MIRSALKEQIEVRELSLETPHHRDDCLRIGGPERALEFLPL